MIVKGEECEQSQGKADTGVLTIKHFLKQSLINSQAKLSKCSLFTCVHALGSTEPHSNVLGKCCHVHLILAWARDQS